MHRGWPIALLLVFLCAPAARAEGAADKALAEALFDEAKRLSAEGKFAEACPKFEESQRRDPGIGTMLYLAHCYEKIDRLASAWGTFREAAQRAAAAGQADREKTASQRAAALEPLIPRLTVRVAPEAKVPGFELLVDGSAVAEALWGTAMPLDGGRHTVEARAPGRHPFRLEMTLEKGGKPSLTIPELALASAPPPPPPAEPRPSAAPVNPAPQPGERPEAGRAPAAAIAPLVALRLGGALPVGKTGAAADGASQPLSSLVGAGPAAEVNAGARLGQRGAALLFYSRQFLGASSDIQGSVRSSYRQAAGLMGQWATSHDPRGAVGFFGEAGVVALDQVALSTTSPAGEPPCSADSKLNGVGVRVGGGAHIPLASRLLLSPLISADIGRFGGVEVSSDGGCQRKSGGYSLSRKDIHASLFAGVSLSLPLELR